MVRKDIEEPETYTLRQVDYSFAGVHPVSDQFKLILAKSLAKLPRNIVDWTTENLFFVSTSDKEYAFSLSKKEWRHKRGFVFLSDLLKDLDEGKQAFIIAHEVAHHKLEHKSPVFNKLTERKVAKQEWEADTLANEWLCLEKNVRELPETCRSGSDADYVIKHKKNGKVK
jgi:Zn-dependent peptidase ImmA (M78 family)